MTPRGNSTTRETRWVTAGALAFVIVTSFFTYFFRYDYPQAPFWDEPYHIASAEKYLHGVFFMEPHPPLGKLLIALGEKLIGDNAVTDTFTNTDYARNIPSDFSFRGMRFFPTLLGWLIAPLLFWCLVLLTRSPLVAAGLSTVYIFDNAEIVHSRGAMLDSTLSFTSLVVLLLFLLLLRGGGRDIYRHATLSFFLGVAFALAMTTKVVSLVFILVLLPLLWTLRKSRVAIGSLLVASAVGFLITYIGVWQVHFTLGTKIEPRLPDQGYYQASPEYQRILADERTSDLASFPIMLRDSLRFVSHYSRGVPRLDLCKPEENGSPSFLWPVGARTISYRWERAGDAGTRYLYLVANPVAWGAGLLGVILSTILLATRVFGERTKPLEHEMAMTTLLGLYVSYMVAISMIDRVMYLYHYFLPLLLSFLLLGVAFANIRKIGPIIIGEQQRILIATVLGLLVFGAFQYYRPLTYYQPITDDALTRRNLFSSWEMVCAGCERQSPLVIPRKGP